MTGSSTKQAGAPGVRSGTQLSSPGGTTMTDETISAPVFNYLAATFPFSADSTTCSAAWRGWSSTAGPDRGGPRYGRA